jgi:2-oxoisovalerate dehydrogenase E1 component
VGLDQKTLLEAYRNMVTSRAIDDEEIHLKRKNQLYFQISGAGHEAILTAAAMAMRPAYDYFLPYYRDRALCLRLGMTPYEMFLQGVGGEDDPNSGGRQMPAHWGHAALNIVSKSSCTGMHALHAVGVAEAGRYLEQVEAARERASEFHDDEVVYMSIGDGSISEGEFWEGLNSACNMSLPIVFLVEDNGYAISTPSSVQIAGIPIHEQVASFPHLKIFDVDGTDLEASYATMTEAVEYCRQRKGAALVHATTVRPYAHSMSDDQSLYRSEEEIEEEKTRDPLTRLRKRLITDLKVKAEDLDALEAECRSDVKDASARALASQRHRPENAELYLYSPDHDVSSSEFEVEPEPEGEGISILEAINRTLHDEMGHDARIVVFGEDVADATIEEVLEERKGKGGVFKATAGLQRAYGGERVFNSPLAEANIIGRAVGMAVRGLKPVVEIQFFDYIWPAYMQIKNELATMRWRSYNSWSAPVVVRVATGGYLQGGAMFHSQSGVNLFASIPGLRVVMPSNTQDAVGLLRTAIRGEDPVMFLEHKHLYRQPYAKMPYPGADYTVPFGKARVHQEGSGVTIVTYGALVRRSELAAKQLEKESGLSVEILDLRSLSPWDHEAVATSVRKTNRCLVVYEDHKTLGFGAEVAAWVADELFEHLDAPVRRVAALDTHIAYQPDTENATLPQTEDVAEALREISRY